MPNKLRIPSSGIDSKFELVEKTKDTILVPAFYKVIVRPTEIKSKYQQSFVQMPQISSSQHFDVRSLFCRVGWRQNGRHLG
jgi:hypothetical protein